MAKKNTRSKKNLLNTLSESLMIGGLFLAIFSVILYVSHFNPQRLAFNHSSLQMHETNQSLTPTRVVIKDLDINLKVYPSTIVNGEWETTTNGVSYLSASSAPGEKGNAIFYGHNWTSLLANLVNVKPGESIDIYYDHDIHKKFIVENTALVSPNDVNILLPSKEPMLTIYTCAGLFDSKRFVVTARPQKI